MGRSQWEQARQRREPQRGQQPEACLRQEERPGFPRPPAPCLARRFVTCTPPGKGTWPPGLGLPGGPAVSPWALKCPRVLVHQSPCTPAPGVCACVVCVAWGVSAQALPPGAPPHLASVHPCPQAECIPLTRQRVTCVHLQGAVTVERWGAPGAVSGAISRSCWWQGGAPPGPGLPSAPQLCSKTARRAQGRSRGALS